MTGVEVYRAVLAELKHENTTSMTPAEFRHHIKIAQIEYMNLRYMVHEQHQKPIDDLAIWHIETNGVGGNPSPIANTGAMAPGEDMFLLPINYAHLLNVEAKVKYVGEPCRTDGTESDWIAAKFVDDSQEKTIRHHHYVKPAPRYPRMRYKSRTNGGVQLLQILAGKSIPFLVNVTYLRIPTPISIDDSAANVQSSELSDPQTYEIIKWCVASYLEKIESVRQQSLMMLLGITNQLTPPYPPENAG